MILIYRSASNQFKTIYYEKKMWMWLVYSLHSIGNCKQERGGIATSPFSYCGNPLSCTSTYKSPSPTISYSIG